MPDFSLQVTMVGRRTHITLLCNTSISFCTYATSSAPLANGALRVASESKAPKDAPLNSCGPRMRANLEGQADVRLQSADDIA